MSEKESQINMPNSVDIWKECAQENIRFVFMHEPSLVIRGGDTIYWDLSARYTEDLQPYRKGEKSDLCIYYIPNDKQVLISQVYPEIYGKSDDIDGYPLRIFLDPNSNASAKYYTAKPQNWHESAEGYIADVEHPRSRYKGLRDRVESVLMAAERKTRTFIHYQMFFADDRDSLEVPRERLSGDKLPTELLNYHIRTLEMLEQIRDHQRGFRFDDFGGGILPMYDHEPYINHKVHM